MMSATLPEHANFPALVLSNSRFSSKLDFKASCSKLSTLCDSIGLMFCSALISLLPTSPVTMLIH